MKSPSYVISGFRYIMRARAIVRFTYASLQVLLNVEIIEEYDHQMSNSVINLSGDDRQHCLSDDDSQECNSAFGDDSQQCLDDYSQQRNSELGDDCQQCLSGDSQECNSTR